MLLYKFVKYFLSLYWYLQTDNNPIRRFSSNCHLVQKHIPIFHILLVQPIMYNYFFFSNLSANQANIYLFKINNRTLEKGGKYVCSQLTINTLFSSVSTNFEQVNVSSENTTFIPITKQNRHGIVLQFVH